MIWLFALLGGQPSFFMYSDAFWARRGMIANSVAGLEVLFLTGPSVSSRDVSKFEYRVVFTKDFNSFKNYVWSTLLFIVVFTICAVLAG